jgi:phosphate regulon transcriptional regulator PhoB
VKVLVVDDEIPILDAVAYNLRKEGFQPLTAEDAEQCMRLAKSEKPELIILDVMLPSASGFDICKRIRSESHTPIIMLTARADETDRVVGLELGADDYVTKPFSMRELMARVKTVLRRSNAITGNMEEVIDIGGIHIDSNRYEVNVNGNPVTLSPKEFDLLKFLARHPGQVFTRQSLLDSVWGPAAFVEDRTVDVHVRWLREKIEADPSQPRFLMTVRGIGYKFCGET